MVYRVKTYTVHGVKGCEIIVEVDSNRAVPTIEIIGLADLSIKEAKERIRGTLRNSGIELPARKVIMNLAPSDVKKVGTSFDLAMAMAVVLVVNGDVLYNQNHLDTGLFFGELGLDGTVKRVNGVLPAVISAMKEGYSIFFVPTENAFELSCLPDITVLPLEHFRQIIGFFYLGTDILKQEFFDIQKNSTNIIGVDFKEIRGHGIAKRALSIAAAGFHNVLLVGPPGSGKSMLIKALHGILPPMNFEEVLEVSQIYSIVGKLGRDLPLIQQRPLRAVHHTASKVSIIGGGQALRPGEVSLAHRGILFFDELAEFPREVLEVLRQPLEEKKIVVSRVTGSVEYPANIMFISAMNPCRCGFYKDIDKQCLCSFHEIKKYQGKISGPFLDRIDMIIEVAREQPDMLFSQSESQSTEKLHSDVLKAWEKQKTRYEKEEILTNADLTSKLLGIYGRMDSEAEEILKEVAKKLFLSGRAIHRMIKVARTIADIADHECIQREDIMESLQYRGKNYFVE